MKQHSLRTELVLWSVGILVFFMATQLIATQIFAHNFATENKERAIASLMEQLLLHYSDDPLDIYDIVEESQDIENLKIMVFSEHSLIYHSDSIERYPDRSPFTKGSLDTKFDLDSLLEDRNTMLRQRQTQLEESLFLDRQEFLNRKDKDTFPEEATLFRLEDYAEDVVGMEEQFLHQGAPRTIMIWSSVEAIDGTVALFFAVNTRVSVFVIFVTVLAVIVFSGRLLAPIETMEKIASNVADLDFSTTAPDNTRTRELSSLAQSINLMSENLEEMITQLSSDNRSLWDKVENQEKLDQMRRQFVANISHEMKTPLSMLMMYSENLKLDLPHIDKEFYYDTIIEEAAGLNQMVEQLLDTSAIENGLAQVTLEPLDFSQFVLSYVEKIAPLLEEYEFSMTIPPDIMVKGERKYLESAIRNYFTNAMSHTPSGGVISLTVSCEDEVIFSLYNDGSPIPVEDLPFLWDSFYRGEKSRTQVGEKRVGLGLYIVKTSISSHLGQVFVENHPHGVMFSFTLPKG